MALCDKISLLFPTLENFIDTYKSGLFNPETTITISSNHSDEQFVIAGLWNQKKFDSVLLDFLQVQNNLEQIFRDSIKT